MLTAADAVRVLTSYDAGDFVALRAAAHGVTNETALIETTRGRFVLRRNQRRHGLQQLQQRHRLLEWLQRRAFPAPRLLRHHGNTTLLERDGRYYELATYITGDEFDAGRPAQLRGVGSVLARYHRTVSDYQPLPPAGVPRYAPSSLPGLIERVISRDVMAELVVETRWYERRAAELMQRCSDTAYAALPQCLIHGDLHRDNLIFRGDAVAALIDYDQVAVDARIVDLADALVDMAIDRPPVDWSPWGVYRAPLSAAHCNLLLTAYLNDCPLSAAERQALPVLIETVWLQGNLRRVLSTAEAEPEYHQELLDQGRRLSQLLNSDDGPLTHLQMVY
jgi:homoserine kinase type II